MGDMPVAFGFNYRAHERTAFTVTVRVLASETEDIMDRFSVYNCEFAVVPIFIGLRQYLGHHAHRSPVRPYLALGGGIDFITGRHCLLPGIYIAESRRSSRACGDTGLRSRIP